MEIIKLASPVPLSSQLLVASQFQYLLCLVLRLFIDLVKFELFAVLGELKLLQPSLLFLLSASIALLVPPLCLSHSHHHVIRAILDKFSDQLLLLFTEVVHVESVSVTLVFCSIFLDEMLKLHLRISDLLFLDTVHLSVFAKT